MAAAFNLVVVRAAFGAGSLGTRDLVWLAILAGLAINTRASVGGALYLGTALLVAWTAWERHALGRGGRVSAAHGAGALPAIRAIACDLDIVLPLAVLFLLAVAAGIVNFERSGNPFSFIDFRYYDFSNLHRQNDLAVLRNYGEIDLGRVWIGALYYATGVPYVLKAVSPFAEFLHSRYQAIEAPPITPLLTNPLTIVLGAVGLYRLCSKPPVSASGAALLRLALIGHAAVAVVILAAMNLALRYRFDFAPFMTLAALVGYRAVSVSMAETPEIRRKRLRIRCDRTVRTRHNGQPLRPSGPQGMEHRRADAGPPRLTALRTFCPCCVWAIMSSRSKLTCLREGERHGVFWVARDLARPWISSSLLQPLRGP